ncbi:MAG: hypothetical protein EOP09_12455 [Proteobacteria bacterium]|nr:MAG: hypothetical protein EOP09_12455 [Pseudomonadota bacterium]
MEALICVAAISIILFGWSVLKNQNMTTRMTRISNALFELGIDMKRLPAPHARLVRKIALRRVLQNPAGANVFQTALECFFAVTVKAQQPYSSLYQAADRSALSRSMVVIANWGRQRKIRLPVAQSALLSLSAHLFGDEQAEDPVTAESFVKAQRILKSVHTQNFQRLNY